MAGIDSFTTLMLHMDGSNGSTTFTDSALTPKTMTAHGGAIISTAQNVFGGASGLFVNATSSYVDTPDSVDFYFGTGDFTVDFRIRFNSIGAGSYSTFCGQFQNANNQWEIYYRQDATILAIQTVYLGAVPGYCYTPWSPSLNIWYHIEFVRNGSTLYIFIDGVSQSVTVSTSFGTNDVGDIAAPFGVGFIAGSSLNYLDGYIDEFRVSKGIARNTSNFTPPSAAYDTGTPPATAIGIQTARDWWGDV